MPNSLTTLTRRVVFAPLDDAGRTEVVVSRIRAAITLGLYGDGEQLPNEVSLAAQLGVSPVTLRDALRSIRDDGLVRTVRGRTGGTFVVAPRESNMRLFERALTSIGVIELRDLLDLQDAVTCHAARLAADRASTRELAGLRQTLAPVGADHDPISVRRALSRYLIEVAASSRSSRLSKTAIELQVEYAPLSTVVLREANARREVAALAGRSLEAIIARDADAAHARMMELTTSLGERIQRARHDLTRTSQDHGEGAAR
jgi:DNA-binding FadR family transcriptional regulator